MKVSDFVHLHVHTEYSLLDGASRIDRLIERAFRLKMPALAITDHGTMSGVVKFYKTAREKGIKPILGCEVYTAPGSRFEKTTGLRNPPFHLTLLSRDESGYRNLIDLSSRGYLEGFYYKPRIDRELLEAKHGGLIALSGCLKGEIPRALLKDDKEGAREIAGYYRDLFGPDGFYLELHDHGIAEQRRLNPMLIELARDLDIPLVAANDCHYILKEDAFSQEVLLCLQTGKKLEDEKRMRLSTEEFYLKSEEEMRSLFGDYPGAISNTRRIADLCNLELEFGKNLLPDFPVPPGKKPDTYLRELCDEGIRRRFGEKSEEITERLEHELEVIEGKQFVSYFLIVWDLIRYAKSRKIPVGPGRGSAAGSLVAYVLGITDINPFDHDLLFERFLNPHRIALPDIDMDICDQRRGELIQYVSEKYGRDRVCQIITFGSMKARAVIRDVGRVLGYPYGEVDQIAKLIPAGPKITLSQALDMEPKLKQLYKLDDEMKNFFDVCFKLEGISRNASTHAAGVLISSDPLTENVPLCRGKDDEVVTQFDMHDSEAVGLLKMDFLGLRTLSVIQDTVDLIEEIEGEKIEISEIPLDDPETFQLLSKANTVGVFQLESSGMRDLSHRIGLKQFSDILALVALYRPGPMHMLEDYVSRKHGQVTIKYDHPSLEPVLKDTYGVMLYQEQVMRIANKLAGFSLADADNLRKAMAKKKVEAMARLEVSFIEGARSQGIKKNVAEDIFKSMARFAEYGFNKSHSAAYALIAYRTAYLKAHYPREYMAALLTSEINNMDKLMDYVAECREMGLEVLPPDINESFANFTVVGDNIRFGLNAIKNVGLGAVEEIIAVRKTGGPFHDFFEFIERIVGISANKKVLESLIKSGALDSFPGHRSQKLAILEDTMRQAQEKHRDREAGQSTLFEAFEAEAHENGESKFPAIEEWPENESLEMEKELLGMYISGHPLTAHEKTLKVFTTHTIDKLSRLKNKTMVRVGGIIEQVDAKISRRSGKKFAFCQLEDMTGVVEITLYSKEFARCEEFLQEGQVVILEGRVTARDRGSNILVNRIYPIEKAREVFARALHVNVHLAAVDENILVDLQKALASEKGRCPVYLDFDYATGEKIKIEAGPDLRVRCTNRLISRVEEILGEETAFIIAK